MWVKQLIWVLRGRHHRRALLSPRTPLTTSFPFSGSSSVSGRRGRLCGHGPTEQDPPRDGTAEPAGAPGE